MRGVGVLVLLLLLGGLGFWLWTSTGDAPPPASPDSPAEADRKTPAPAAPERSTLPLPTPAPAPAAAGTADNTAPPTPMPTDTAAQVANVVIAVRDQTTQQTIPAVAWRYRSATATLRGDGTDGRLTLALPAGSEGELLLEARDYQPYTVAALSVPAAGAPPVSMDALLVPAATATGIALQVRDLQQQPIRNLRVDAFALTAENRDTAWHLGRSLWSRRTRSEDGAYTLPPLQPGDYGIRIYAVDEGGEPLALLPWSRTFALTGSNGFREDILLEPACVLTLELLDRTNQPYDPSKFGMLTLALGLQGAPATQRLWAAKAGDARAVAMDVLPGIGTTTAADPIAPGSYQLEISVNGEPRLVRTLVLRAGEQQTERLVVP